uniref:Prospero homeobox protein 1-like n=1 Tax=Mastacembelus armatus TaxID=205130 RepID=A0A3Q3MLT6_9TELE
MNPSAWSKGMYSSSIICFDGCPAEHLSSFQPDPVLSDVSGASATLHKDCDNQKMLPESAYYSGGESTSSLIYSSNPPRDNTTRMHPPPASSSSGHHDWNLTSGHQAKRARVENIIKGMTSSPGVHCSDVMSSLHEKTDCMQENEKIQELHQRHMERSGTGSMSHSQTRKHLENQQHVRQPGTRFKYVDEVPERIKLMADVLKYELSRAVSRSVDSIFKSMPLLQTSPNSEGTVETDTSPQSSVCNDNKLRLSCCGNKEVQVPDVQTEALSLVVQKPGLERPDKFILQSRSKAHHDPKPQFPFSLESALHEDQQSRSNNIVHQHALRCLQDRRSEAKFKTFDTRWNSVKVSSKVNARSVRSPLTNTVSVDPGLLESLHLPHVKIESDSFVRNKLYVLNEGLTTNHLKKAKLMFFYTRYPSSLVLKMCFHDVQFTRCITSQLIKWFSNFREFYYIQMEKFARHALMEGVADVRDLTVGRESELFRALNMHYNKANDFQVPNRFLEVAEITLREFYIAISMCKDREPSWKKAIYKVICKLDSDVPDEFKHPHSG